MYAWFDDEGVFLSGDAGDLAAVVTALRLGRDAQFDLAAETESTGEALRQLAIVARDSDVVTITAGEGVLRVAGDSGALTRLATGLQEFLDYNDLMAPGVHTHFDPGDTGSFDGSILVAMDSAPLVVAGPVRKAG